jgi:hypothetical protein
MNAVINEYFIWFNFLEQKQHDVYRLLAWGIAYKKRYPIVAPLCFRLGGLPENFRACVVRSFELESGFMASSCKIPVRAMTIDTKIY